MSTVAEIQQLKLAVEEADTDQGRAETILTLLKSRNTVKEDKEKYAGQLFQLAENLPESSYKAWAQ